MAAVGRRDVVGVDDGWTVVLMTGKEKGSRAAESNDVLRRLVFGGSVDESVDC